MTKEEARENNRQAVKAIKQYIHADGRLEDSSEIWKDLVSKYFQGDEEKASKMLVAVMSFPNL